MKYFAKYAPTIIGFLTAIAVMFVLQFLQKYVSAYFFSDFFNGWVCCVFYFAAKESYIETNS